MTKEKIVDEMRRAHEMSEADASRAFDSAIDGIKTVLLKEQRVRVPGIGRLDVVRPTGTRNNFNPISGLVQEVTRKPSVRLRASPVLTKLL